ncbi:MAG: sigma-70 family RNA polymerase sigma factor [Planctomycetes bacterium]|nr:sigma-70 family RNA polymerase sigma factor [Planctomycetota bacterium]
MGGGKKRQEIRSGQGRLDAAAWATIYQHYYPRIRSRFAARVEQEQDVDDLAEGVFAKLARKGRPNDLKAYIATTVANALSGYQRRKARERDFLQRLLEEAAREDPMCRYKARDWFEEGKSGAGRDKVEKILSTLPRGEARLLKLRFLQGLPMADVARRAGCSREVAYKRVQRIIRRLRDRYGVEPDLPKKDQEQELPS